METMTLTDMLSTLPSVDVQCQLSIALTTLAIVDITPKAPKLWAIGTSVTVVAHKRK